MSILSEGLRSAIFRSPLYMLTLKTARAGQIIAIPPDPTPGDPETGAEIMAGRYPSPTGPRERGSDPWNQTNDDGSDASLHSFSWLRDLVAVDSETSRTRARALVEAWLARHDRWHPVAWRPDVLSERTVRWLTAMPSLARDDTAWSGPVLDSIARQVRHLSRVAFDARARQFGFSISRGLIAAGVSLDGQQRALAVGLETLAHALSLQILPDGGHISRSPVRQLDAVESLIEIREILVAAGQEVPVPLNGAIERMAPFARAMRLGDSRFTLFNGAREGSAERIDAALSQTGTRGRALASAPHSGYQRLAAGRTVIVADVGGPPPIGFDADAHAGPLAFEMSSGRRRLIVNCGAHPDPSSPWHAALKATAAHSTVTIDDSNAFSVGSGRLLDYKIVVSCQRRESENNVAIEAFHHGYRARFGVIHQRTIYLSADGVDVRGHDSLNGPEGHRYVVRFHLHPDVKASPLEDGASALLKLGDGEGWRLRISGGGITLEESVYHGMNEPRRTEQVTVAGALTGTTTEIKWGLRREGN